MILDVISIPPAPEVKKPSPGDMKVKFGRPPFIIEDVSDERRCTCLLTQDKPKFYKSLLSELLLDSMETLMRNRFWKLQRGRW